MKKGGYYSDTIKLVKEISIQTKTVSLKNVLINYYNRFKKIKEKIILIQNYKQFFEPQRGKYLSEMERLNQGTGKELFEVIYLDLLNKMKIAPTDLHQISSICLLVPIITDLLGKGRNNEIMDT